MRLCLLFYASWVYAGSTRIRCKSQTCTNSYNDGYDLETPRLQAAPRKLTLLHTNDIHAHLEEFNNGGTSCKQPDIDKNQCYGGVARIKTKVLEFRQTRKDVILVDAGDQFQGTLFFTLFGGYPSAEAMNDLKYDAMTIGNHEFDSGIEHLAQFIKNLTFPVLTSNIEADILKSVGVKPYTILPKHNVGIIGYITNTLPSLVNNDIMERMIVSNPIDTVQKAVDALHAKGIKRIICVSHNGYQDDQNLASNTYGIHLIIGGHSHSLLHKNASLGPEGPYPTKIRNQGGSDTFVVQAHRYGDYLGHVDLEWDELDNLISIDGDPILLDQNIAKEQQLQAKVSAWGKEFDKATNDVLTRATETFEMDCANRACNMGYLIADCMLSEQNASGVVADVAFINDGGIRSALQAGDVTYSDAINVLPFGNVVVMFQWKGQQILDILENAAAGKNKAGKEMMSILQWAGLRYAVKPGPEAKDFHRVSKVTINGNDLDLKRIYTIVADDFITNGGDDIMEPIKTVPGIVLADTLANCLRRHPTISPVNDGRVSHLIK